MPEKYLGPQLNSLSKVFYYVRWHWRDCLAYALFYVCGQTFTSETIYLLTGNSQRNFYRRQKKKVTNKWSLDFYSYSKRLPLTQSVSLLHWYLLCSYTLLCWNQYHLQFCLRSYPICHAYFFGSVHLLVADQWCFLDLLDSKQIIRKQIIVWRKRTLFIYFGCEILLFTWWRINQ